MTKILGGFDSKEVGLGGQIGFGKMDIQLSLEVLAIFLIKK